MKKYYEKQLADLKERLKREIDLLPVTKNNKPIQGEVACILTEYKRLIKRRLEKAFSDILGVEK